MAYQEGDKVLIEYGEHQGERGVVTEVAPSGSFYAIAIRGKHAGYYSESDLAPATVIRLNQIEAYGVKGLANKPWRRMFKSAAELTNWAEKHDAEVHGTRTLEDYEKTPVNRR
ncbi:MAG TPA: hypothetical protein VFA33_06100 [Bryobacteraceae bacterium]|nr:hypothetical protein [Bryobacteraceae bacterium]